ncbi:hypothetical protein TRFO_14960 [Tritrichomonas foetus]|uniref:Myb-like DNA-binding domain containing protein n=1 Tax=Tritrichomonas foetus TaxID=1144522 RepID=A0A1J4KY69_9EUKA|nr:hypothetical protein TRFO_14960 [Tritrichomonas foetus]|eukprot:OHT14652.1 hypothetical protein TRFO_14960 [Tritrichomonas foetus]
MYSLTLPQSSLPKFTSQLSLHDESLENESNASEQKPYLSLLKNLLNKSNPNFAKTENQPGSYISNGIKSTCNNQSQESSEDENQKSLLSNPTQSQHQNQNQSHNSQMKSKWTPEEDNLLVNTIAKFGTKNWSLVASEVTGRTGKQCRERWLNQLSPDLNKDHWTPQEDQILIQFQAYYGNSWSKIAYSLPGRSANSIKNRWSFLLRHRALHAVAANFTNHFLSNPQTISPSISPIVNNSVVMTSVPIHNASPINIPVVMKQSECVCDEISQEPYSDKLVKKNYMQPYMILNGLSPAATFLSNPTFASTIPVQQWAPILPI